MTTEYSLGELVFTAVLFFLVAVISLLAALRMAGYLGGGQEGHWHDELELMRWLDRVGMSYRELDSGVNNGTAIMICIANTYVYFFFNERGELVGDDAQSSV